MALSFAAKINIVKSKGKFTLAGVMAARVRGGMAVGPGILSIPSSSGGGISGSTLILRTLQRSPIMGKRSVYAEEKKVQPRV